MNLKLTLFALLWPCALQAQTIALRSPDRVVGVNIETGKTLSYTVSYKGAVVLENSPLGFEFNNAVPLNHDLKILKMLRTTVNSKWIPVVPGRHRIVNDHCNQLCLQLQESQAPFRKLDLFFRAYNDGIAFRYELRHNKPGTAVMRELTGFHFAGNDTAWMAGYGAYTTSQESEFIPAPLSGLGSRSIIGLPFLTKVSDHCFAAITEANITDWPGFYIGRDTTVTDGYLLTTKLSPHPDQADSSKVDLQADHLSPWRVILLGDEPGKLIESEMIENLNAPNILKDVSWVKPGKCAWDHWWSGEVKMDTKTIEQYIQFAADMHFPYMLIDWQWYGDFNKPNSDITKVTPEVDMPAVLQFAKERKVKCWLWLYNTDAAKQYAEAFPVYRKWGIAGIKIDFMNSDDQEMVNWYHKIIRCAADNHLMVNFHGAYKPDGFQRTYPNLMTREGVMGNEYNKWSARETPEHNTTLPFTRMLAGPMDYTPGGFLNRSAAKFKNAVPAQVMTTRCQQLAMFVVYDSPVTTVCDNPDNYYGQPGLDFLKVVPTTWDDTKVLAGYPGKFICVARRSGKRWFLAAMNNSEDRTITIPLSFLSIAKYKLTSFSDAADADENAEHLNQNEQFIKKGQSLTIKMAKGGGYAGYIDQIH